VLVVDDDPLFVEWVGGLLTAQEEIDVCGRASSGEAAIEAARELRPDCVAMDIAMPGIGGIAASRAIREELPDTRVVLVSGSIFSDFCEAVEDADAEAYTTKSRIAADLPATILRVCGRTAQAAAPPGRSR
jgi:DNA-binding NarL/FixJ family response regulator